MQRARDSLALDLMKALRPRMEIHHIRKLGSWFNMPELQLTVLQHQCLDRRQTDRATIEHEVAAWVAARNATEATIDGRFTTAGARINLKRLYPAVHP